MMGKTYICAECDGEFEQTRSDEEAMAEALQEHPGVRPDDMEMVCCDCWDAIKKRTPEWGQPRSD